MRTKKYDQANDFEPVLIAGVVSGCSMAPKYVRPDAPVAATYAGQTEAEGQTASTSQAHVAEIGWRNFFPDQRLQF
jgi:multidrug efflux system outer membrane protein